MPMFDFSKKINVQKRQKMNEIEQERLQKIAEEEASKEPEEKAETPSNPMSGITADTPMSEILKRMDEAKASKKAEETNEPKRRLPGEAKRESNDDIYLGKKSRYFD